MSKKGIYVYQQIEMTTAEWADNTTVYPASVWLFERLDNGKFNMKLSDGVHPFSELKAVLQDVEVRVSKNDANNYVLEFVTADGTILTPNLRSNISVKQNDDTTYILTIRAGDTTFDTPNLRMKVTVKEHTANSYILTIRTGDITFDTPNLAPGYDGYIPTLAEKPDETTLTYQRDDKTVAFILGQFARVPSKKMRSGYTFYQLANIVDGVASWQESGSGGTSSKALVEQTGIFNNAGAGWNSFTYPFPFNDDVRIFLTPANVKLRNQTKKGFQYCLYTPEGEMDGDTYTLINWQAVIMSEEQLCANIAKATESLDPLSYFTLAELFTSENAAIIMGNDAAKALTLESARAVAAYICAVLDADATEYTEISVIAEDAVFMAAVAASATAMEAVAASATAMEAVAASATSLVAIASSEVAIGIIFADEDLLNKYIFTEENLQIIVNNDTAMAAVAASPVSLSAIASSDTARETFQASEYYTEYVAEVDKPIAQYVCYLAKTEEIYDSMAAVAASGTAMAAVAASGTAMAAVAASGTAMAAVAASGTALSAIASSAVAAGAVQDAIQDQRETILKTLGTANSTYFNYSTKNIGNGNSTVTDGQNTNTIYIPYNCNDDRDTTFTAYYGYEGSKQIVSIQKHNGDKAVTQGVSLRGVKVVGSGGTVGYFQFHIYSVK